MQAVKTNRCRINALRLAALLAAGWTLGACSPGVSAVAPGDAAITAGVTGVVRTAAVQVAERVEAGQVLAEIDAREVVRASQAIQLEVARLQLHVSRLLRERGQHAALREQGFGAGAQIDYLDGAIADALARMEALERQGRDSAARLAQRVARAPFSACVQARRIETGDPVREGEVLYVLRPVAERDARCAGSAARQLARHQP